ncbi:MAG TPA: hypothetical protein VLA19_16150, partial [Herpetosiphonaceae bacterium]|nr:hypothetical protein [Herpetosiphonaceae bacterium]
MTQGSNAGGDEFTRPTSASEFDTVELRGSVPVVPAGMQAGDVLSGSTGTYGTTGTGMSGGTGASGGMERTVERVQDTAGQAVGQVQETAGQVVGQARQ